MKPRRSPARCPRRSGTRWKGNFDSAGARSKHWVARCCKGSLWSARRGCTAMFGRACIRRGRKGTVCHPFPRSARGVSPPQNPLRSLNNICYRRIMAKRHPPGLADAHRSSTGGMRFASVPNRASIKKSRVPPNRRLQACLNVPELIMSCIENHVPLHPCDN